MEIVKIRQEMEANSGQINLIKNDEAFSAKKDHELNLARENVRLLEQEI